VETIALNIGTTAGQYRCHHIMWRMAIAATR
jgi:pyrrolidone-carboxylate peptidase